MPLFSEYGAQMFGESFSASYELEKQLKERREEIEREYNFKNRQLKLDEAFRRDQLSLDKTQTEQQGRYYNMLGEKYSSDIYEGYVPAPEGTQGAILGSELQGQYPTLGSVFQPEQYYLDKDLIPETSKPITQSRLKPYGGATLEEQFIQTPEGETIVGYEQLISPDRSKETIPENKFSEFYNAAASHLAQLKGLYNIEGTESASYINAKQKATESVYNALESSGITKNILDALRQNIEGLSKEDYEERRRLLNDAVNKLDQTYELTPEQLKALKLWSEIGTR